MNKLFVFALILVVLICVVKGCDDCPRPPPVVPVFCDWEGNDCGKPFADLDDDFSNLLWKQEPGDYDFEAYFVDEGDRGNWYFRVFNFEVYSYNSGSIVYPTLAAFGAVVAAFA